ncbi:MAG: hypothetical protein IPH54_15660 [Rhodoferax sp.]|nr:hypothetical protein [Rhodoferax sp.]
MARHYARKCGRPVRNPDPDTGVDGGWRANFIQPSCKTPIISKGGKQLGALSETRERTGLPLNIRVRMAPENIATVRGLATVSANAGLTTSEPAPFSLRYDDGAFGIHLRRGRNLMFAKRFWQQVQPSFSLNMSGTSILTWRSHRSAHYFVIAIQAEGDVCY